MTTKELKKARNILLKTSPDTFTNSLFILLDNLLDIAENAKRERPGVVVDYKVFTAEITPDRVYLYLNKTGEPLLDLTIDK